MTLQVGGVFSWIKKLFQHIFHFLFKFRGFFFPKKYVSVQEKYFIQYKSRLIIKALSLKNA